MIESSAVNPYGDIARLLRGKHNFLASNLRSQDRRVLELFCATGEHCALLREESTEREQVYFGVDLDSTALQVAAGKGVISVASDVHRLPFNDDSFDVVYCNSLHHTPLTAEIVVREAMRVLKPGGRFVGTEGFGFAARVALVVVLNMPRFLTNRVTYLREIVAEESIMRAWHKNVPLIAIFQQHRVVLKKRVWVWMNFVLEK